MLPFFVDNAIEVQIELHFILFTTRHFFFKEIIIPYFILFDNKYKTRSSFVNKTMIFYRTSQRMNDHL